MAWPGRDLLLNAVILRECVISCRESGRWRVRAVLVFWSYVGSSDSYGWCRPPYLEHFALYIALWSASHSFSDAPLICRTKERFVIAFLLSEMWKAIKFSYVGSCNVEREIFCFVDRASRYIRVMKTNLMRYLSSVYFVSQLYMFWACL
jgi:hypothetical protein